MKKYTIILIIPFIFTFVLLLFSNSKTNTYTSLNDSLKQSKTAIALAYKNEKDNGKDSVINNTKQILLDIIVNQYFNFWYHTPWSFYRQTKTPKKGTIACGYFVTTVLFDAGFNIPRVAWAKLPSEVFIKKMTTDLIRFRSANIDSITKYIKNKKDGLYIVGLDCHVGFIYKLNNKIQFVHSSYYKPEIGVLSENLNTDNPLKNSKYVVIGQILTNKNITDWIENKAIK